MKGILEFLGLGTRFVSSPLLPVNDIQMEEIASIFHSCGL